MANWLLGIETKTGNHIAFDWSGIFQNMTNHKNILQGGKYGCPLIFFKQKSFLRPPVINFRCLSPI
jgi:hypothetical protein